MADERDSQQTDTEAHSFRDWSNRDFKDDIETLDDVEPAGPKSDETGAPAPSDSDTEAHAFREWSNRDFKDDIESLDPPTAEPGSVEPLVDADGEANPPAQPSR